MVARASDVLPHSATVWDRSTSRTLTTYVYRDGFRHYELARDPACYVRKYFHTLAAGSASIKVFLLCEDSKDHVLGGECDQEAWEEEVTAREAGSAGGSIYMVMGDGPDGRERE